MPDFSHDEAPTAQMGLPQPQVRRLQPHFEASSVDAVTVAPSHEGEDAMGSRSMTVERYEEIRRRLAEGRSLREIARALNCSRDTVREVRDGARQSPDTPKSLFDPLWMLPLDCNRLAKSPCAFLISLIRVYGCRSSRAASSGQIRAWPVFTGTFLKSLRVRGRPRRFSAQGKQSIPSIDGLIFLHKRSLSM